MIIKTFYKTGEGVWVEECMYKNNLDVKKTFSSDGEKTFVKYIITDAKMHYGLTKKGVRELAFKFARANIKKMPQNWKQEKSAREKCMRYFM